MLSTYKHPLAGTTDTLATGSNISVDTFTATGLITGNLGITVPSPQILTSAGTITANVINASGLITGDAGITVPSPQILTSDGTITANVINTSGLITATKTTSGTNDILNMQYDTRNGIRWKKRWRRSEGKRADKQERTHPGSMRRRLKSLSDSVGQTAG